MAGARRRRAAAGVPVSADTAEPSTAPPHNSSYRRMIAACDRLADAALEGVDATALTQAYADAVSKPVVLLDPSFGIRAQAGPGETMVELGWDLAAPSVGRLLHTLEVQRRPLRVPSVPGSSFGGGCLISPIAVEGDVLGYLVVLDDDSPEPDDVDVVTATYAATLFALTLARERTSTELGQQYRRAVVDALVSGHFIDADDARAKARALGLGDTTPFRVAVVNAWPGMDVTELSERLSGAIAGSLVTQRDNDVLLLLPERSGGPSLADLWPRLTDAWAGALVTCGVSEPVAHAELTPRAVHQAEQAVDVGTRIGRNGQVVPYDDLGIYRLLLRIGDMRELWAFADDVLGPLIDHDMGHTPDLVRTLSEYLRHQGSLKQVARSLGVHPNTVGYRIQRIEKMTGLDLSDPDDRLLSHVAVKIVETHRPR